MKLKLNFIVAQSLSKVKNSNHFVIAIVFKTPNAILLHKTLYFVTGCYDCDNCHDGNTTETKKITDALHNCNCGNIAEPQYKDHKHCEQYTQKNIFLFHKNNFISEEMINFTILLQ